MQGKQHLKEVVRDVLREARAEAEKAQVIWCDRHDHILLSGVQKIICAVDINPLRQPDNGTII